MKNKLKRHRIKSLSSREQAHIDIKKPTPDSPALRAVHSNDEFNFGNMLAIQGVQDLRGKKKIPTFKTNELINQIVCGDSLKILSSIPSDVVDCVITSPPYWHTVDYGFSGQYGQGQYQQYLNDLLQVWKECFRVLRPNGKLCINSPIMPISKAIVSHQHTRHLKNINNDIEHSILNGIPGLYLYSLYIWQKQTTEKMFGSYPFPPNLYEQNTIEFINVYVKEGKPKILSKKAKEMSRISSEEWMNLTRQIWPLYPDDVRRTRHPASFPVSLPNRLISMYTFKTNLSEDFGGDLVLDPFCGSGSTCVAAKQLGRNYLGIDLSPEFCAIAAGRALAAHYEGKIFLIKDKLPPAQQNDAINLHQDAFLPVK